MTTGPRKLSDLLPGVLAESALAEGLRHQEALECWVEVVGEDIARHSRAVGLADGVLLVQVEGSVWAQELSLLKPQIQATLEERLGSGTVKDIRFHSGSV